MVQENKFKRGFTIVELLIVIVVIAILAAITIVSYSGITARASAAKAATNAAAFQKVVETYNADMNAYPALAAVDSPSDVWTPVNGGTQSVVPASGITPVASSNGALTSTNMTTNIIYVQKTGGACIAYYDPTYTSATLPSYTNVKVLLSGSATGFSANPNTGVATCS